MRIIASIAALGVAAMTTAGPASAQVGRFDPALGMGNPLPITTVQSDQSLLRMRPGGPAGPGTGASPRGPGGGPAFAPGGPRGGNPGMQFGGGNPQRGQSGFGPREGNRGQQFGQGRGQRYGGDYRRRGGNGFGVGAGIAAGALIGGAIASQAAPGYGYGYGYGTGYDPDPGVVVDTGDVGYAPSPPTEDTVYAGGGRDDAYCTQRYRSYDPASGTYLGYDGLRHPCP